MRLSTALSAIWNTSEVAKNTHSMSIHALILHPNSNKNQIHVSRRDWFEGEAEKNTRVLNTGVQIGFILQKQRRGTTFGLFLELLSVNLRYRKIELVLCCIPRQIKYYLQYQHNSCQPAFANELDTSWFSLLTCQTTESSWRDVKYSMPWCSMIQLVGNVNAACHCAQISSTSQTSSPCSPHKTEF